MLFIASCFSYGDRVALSIAGTAMENELALDPVKLGFLLSGFSWAYVCGQLPSGGLLDRFGSKRVYGISIVCWTICAFLIGFAGYLADGDGSSARSSFCGFSPAWRSRRSFRAMDALSLHGFRQRNADGASAIFNSSQYFALVVFAPLFGWLIHSHGWRSCFWFMGVFGLVLAFAWSKVIYNVKDHPLISAGGDRVTSRRAAGWSTSIAKTGRRPSRRR